MKRGVSIGLLTLTLLATAAGDTLIVQSGNVCIKDDAGQVKSLTSSGRDAEPIFSPDRRWVVFVRSIPGKTIATGVGDSPATELWQIGANGKEATLLVRPKSADKTESLIANISGPQFSADGRNVFFVSDAWATSGAVHVVDTTNGKEHFVCAGGDLEVVPRGEYKDCLLVQQHRYFIGGGTYDWYWLFRSNGKEVGPVGEDTENFKATYVPDK